MVILSHNVIANINGSGYNQFGKDILITQMSFSLLEAIFEVDPEVQRKLDPSRRSEIRDFILKSVEKDYFYFSPFVFSARGAITKSGDSWTLTPGSKLYVLDGQHRNAGLSSAISQLKTKIELAEETNMPELAEKYQSYLEKVQSYPVSMQIYLNLTQQEERQLFTDINTERREAHVGIVMQFDHRDIYTEKTRIIAKDLTCLFEVEQKLSRVATQSSALSSLAVIKKCLLAMFEGDLKGHYNEPSKRYIQPEKIEETAAAFFQMLATIFPAQPADRTNYVSGLSGIQISLAYMVFQLVKHNQLSHHDAIQRLALLKKNCSWKHTDPLFRHLYDPSSRKLKNHSGIKSIEKTTQHFLSILGGSK
jgi:DNA sulfur modification protein DndB